MRIQILALLILNNCSNVTQIKNVENTSTTQSDDSTTLPPTFTSTEFSTSSFGSSSSTTEIDNTSSTTDDTTGDSTTIDDISSSSTGEPVLKCNKTETGECNVFVASQQVFPDMGVEEFANFCTTIACNSETAECGKYKALVRENNDFWEAFTDYEGEWKLPSGKVVASGNASLEFSNSINENEFGNSVPNKTLIWTGFVGMYFTCFNVNTPWTSKNKFQLGDIGFVGGADNTWYTGTQIPCDTSANIICVEVE